MTQEETLKRISKESEQYVSLLFGTLADGTWRINAKKDFIAGAKSERNKALDEAIDEFLYSITVLENAHKKFSYAECKRILESLKVDL